MPKNGRITRTYVDPESMVFSDKPQMPYFDYIGKLVHITQGTPLRDAIKRDVQKRRNKERYLQSKAQRAMR